MSTLKEDEHTEVASGQHHVAYLASLTACQIWQLFAVRSFLHMRKAGWAARQASRGKRSLQGLR